MSSARRRLLPCRPAAALGLVVICAHLSLLSCYQLAGYDELSFGENDGGAGGSAPSQLITRLSKHTPQRLDLLFVIDNSSSMFDKQQVLQLAVGDLIESLVNPRCLYPDGQLGQVPSGPLADCPAGQAREFDPLLDLHIGIITSSLGGHGSSSCEPEQDPNVDPSSNDHGWLVHRDKDGEPVDTFQDDGGNNLGFLAWDPVAPSNDTVITDVNGLTATFKTLVAGPGEYGCGYEATLESWYRFLVDPQPYLTVELDNPNNGVSALAELREVDHHLLQQRRNFLRPDSVLAIVMVSDENDCSIRDGGIYWLAAQNLYPPNGPGQLHLGRPSAECASDPNHECCVSCWDQSKPQCLTNDPGECEPLVLTHQEDQINLRCWDQKRRFGIDFLYPVERYLNGLTQPQVADRQGHLVANPLYSDLDPSDGLTEIRDPEAVFVVGIVGVPWQDIARLDPGPDQQPGTDDDQPNLLAGLNATGQPVGGFRNATELATPIPGKNYDSWALILGEPDTYHTDLNSWPRDPLMIESPAPRTGIHPLTGEALVPPQQAAAWNANTINGHEWANPDEDDLQYACIFPLNEALDCSLPPEDPKYRRTCDCRDASNDLNPLCQRPEPYQPVGRYGLIQFHAKAYPSLRQLRLLKGLGNQGIVGSICPAQQNDTNRADFGYRPALDALLERLKIPLAGQVCFPQSYEVDVSGRLPCLLIEAVQKDVGTCTCSEPARRKLGEEVIPAVAQIKDDPLHSSHQWNCFCEILQTAGDDLQACQNNTAELVTNSLGYTVDGWCYVDAVSVPPIGNTQLAASCPTDERRLLRLVGAGQPAPGAALFIACL